MATGSLAHIVPRLRAAGLVPAGAGGDAELLERFVAHRDGDAFAALVRRHGPMVFAVCRRVLRHTHDAEDAFQATFLVLAHKAHAVSPRGKLAGWLHGVAHKTALKARQRCARRVEVETRAPPKVPDAMHPDTDWAEVEPVLDQELAGLPDHYRLPIVMCDLQDRPRTEVAAALGCSDGTLSSRLTRGRRLLADRLTRRGVHLSVAAVTALCTARSRALAEPLIRATVSVALSFGANGTTGAVPPSVAALATGVMKSMFLKKLRTAALAAFAVATVALALTGAADRGQAAPTPKAAPVPATDEKKAGIDALADAEGRLLMNRKVLKDMKCDFDQFDRIMDALEDAEKKARQKSAEAMGQLNFNAAGNPPNVEALNKMIQDAQGAGEKEFRKAVAAVVADVLTPAQRKRFREIDLQARGFEAFTTPSVINALDISPKQKDQFEANAKQVGEDIAQAFQRPVPMVAPAPAPAPGPVAGAAIALAFTGVDYEKVTRDARAEGLKRALAILTDDQKAAWKKLTGEPFAHPLPLPMNSPRGIRFGGGGGFGGFGGAGVVPAMPLLPAAPAVPVAPVLPGPPLPAPPNPGK